MSNVGKHKTYSDEFGNTDDVVSAQDLIDQAEIDVATTPTADGGRRGEAREGDEMQTLPFDIVDVDRMERERVTKMIQLRDAERREACHGCANDWPVTQMEQIGKTGMFHWIHTGPRMEGGCWCQCPHLHPENAEYLLTEAGL